MAKKIYAVKVGRNTGIFQTWEECEGQIKSYSGAQYKGFTSMNDAEQYLGIAKCPAAEVKEVKQEIPGLNVYVDGSFNSKTNTYGWAYAIFSNGFKNEDGTPGLMFSDFGSGTGSAVEMRNVAGELSAAMRAVKYLYNNHGGITDVKLNVTIIYDYEGIEKWITGEWKTKKLFTKQYVEFMKKYLDGGRLNVSFLWTRGHIGVEGNEFVDGLAKQGCGVL